MCSYTTHWQGKKEHNVYTCIDMTHIKLLICLAVQTVSVSMVMDTSQRLRHIQIQGTALPISMILLLDN